jgi:endoglucanase
MLLLSAVTAAACGSDEGDDGGAGAQGGSSGVAGSNGGSGVSGGTAGSNASGSGGNAGTTGGTSSAGASAGTDSSGGGSGKGGTGATGGTGGTSGSGGSGGSGAVGGEPSVPDVSLSPFIVVDQFGYRPASKKVAVLRDPEVGFDADESFSPGGTYEVVDAVSGQTVFSGAPSAWNGGAVDDSSGDRASWFDFSSVTEPSFYYVLDVENGVRSAVFRVAPNVYAEVLRHAFRTFFYQRAGFEKAAAFAGEAWADAASHVGPGQDREARLFSAQGDASTARDLSGGWYDAGDYNKYTSWHASYVIQMLRAYRQRPMIWGDDSGIPESGNGVPDIIDEVEFGLEFLERMQNDDGSVLSIVGLAHGSPPSAATDPSFYGPATTAASAHSAAAFAFGAVVLSALGSEERAATLRTAAERAYAWAEAHPAVQFRNNDSASGSSGLGAGQQEVDDKGRVMKRLEAACYLFELTGDTAYQSYFDGNYSQATLLAPYAYGWEEEVQEMLLHYTTLEGATAQVSSAIRSAYASALESGENLGAHRDEIDPYLAPLSTYTWGSNSVKARQGAVIHSLVKYGFEGVNTDEVLAAAESYLHYLHGVNPLGIVYLSNMSSVGAEKSVNEFYHSWFNDSSDAWDRVGESTHGPAPGFLTGGPNPSYEWDGCCPDGCGGGNDCGGSSPPSPPANQPPQKSYLDFNANWPQNSWSVTENSNGYQLAYIRLLSQFVD